MKTSRLEKQGVSVEFVALIQRVVRMVPWPERRQAMGDVAVTLLEGKARAAELAFGWNRAAVEMGMQERRTGIVCLNDIAARRRPKVEEKDPALLADIRRIVDPRSHADPQLRTPLAHTNVTAKAVREALVQMGRAEDQLPTVRTVSNLLNRHGYRRRSVAKTKVQKKRRKPARSSPTSENGTRQPMPTPKP